MSSSSSCSQTPSSAASSPGSLLQGSNLMVCPCLTCCSQAWREPRYSPQLSSFGLEIYRSTISWLLLQLKPSSEWHPSPKLSSPCSSPGKKPSCACASRADLSGSSRRGGELTKASAGFIPPGCGQKRVGLGDGAAVKVGGDGAFALGEKGGRQKAE